MRSTAILALAAVAVHAQSEVPTYKSSLNMTVPAQSVDDSRKLSWCNSQDNACETLCDDKIESYDCDYNDLSYSCTCSNGTAPGLEYYIGTMPTYICNELAGQCRAQNAGDLDAQNDCDSNIQELCGTLKLSEADVGGDDDEEEDGDNSSETTTSAPSPSETASDDDDEEQGDASTTESDGFAAPTAAPMGVAAFAALGLAAAMV